MESIAQNPKKEASNPAPAKAKAEPRKPLNKADFIQLLWCIAHVAVVEIAILVGVSFAALLVHSILILFGVL